MSGTRNLQFKRKTAFLKIYSMEQIRLAAAGLPGSYSLEVLGVPGELPEAEVWKVLSDILLKLERRG